MRTLFFDTETTGKAFFNLPPEDPRQPRIASLACIMADGSRELATLSLVIKPEGWTIPDEAVAIHGITTEIATRDGMSIESALHWFMEILAPAGQVVAHNIQFDKLMLRREAGVGVFDGKKTYCTMEAMTPICNLPGNYGPKWPKLEEAYLHCFGRKPLVSHDALADCRACKEIYDWLNKEL